MKALYTVADDILYQVDQDVRIPTHMVRYTDNNLNLIQDSHKKTAEMNLWLNSFDKSREMSNEVYLHKIMRLMKEKQITQIDWISNFFKLSVEYTLFNISGQELEHDIAVYPIKPVDAIIPLNIGTCNTLPYRFVKTFDKVVDFRFKDRMPFGIMEHKECGYSFKINDIRIMQDLGEIPDEHPSSDGRPFIYGSHTMKSYLEHTVLVFSSKDAGIAFNPCELKFIPRLVTFHMQIMLDNYIMTYSPIVLDRIIEENLLLKTDCDDENPRDEHHHHHHHHHCRKEPYIYHGKRGKFVISEPRRKDSLMVVEDQYPHSIFDPKAMIRKYHVLPDCPSIEVGDYVRFIEDIIEDERPVPIYDDSHPIFPHESENMHYSSRETRPKPNEKKPKPAWLQE